MTYVLGWNSRDAAWRQEFWASLALKHTVGMGPRSIVRVLQYFGSAYAAIENLGDLAKWSEAGVTADKSAKVASGSWRTTALKEWTDTRFCSAHIVLWHENAYPPLLRQLVDAPAVLYCRGDVKLLKSPCVSIVGSRRCTKEGVAVASLIAKNLSAAGLTIVSGMAQGIDRVAHISALGHVGRSIAVLGTGLDIIYPQQNKDVHARMVKEGLVISEFAPGTPPAVGNFPVRNRIISGLSLGVLVVEGSIKSGTLITARQALEQGREVYAVPGPTTSTTSQGCHRLVRQGAHAVFSAEDILHDLAPQLQTYTDIYYQKKSSNNKTTKAEKSDFCDVRVEAEMEALPPVEKEKMKAVLALLYTEGGCHTDVLCTSLGLPAHDVNTLLTEMEILGLVKRLPGARFVAQSALA